MKVTFCMLYNSLGFPLQETSVMKEGVEHASSSNALFAQIRKPQGINSDTDVLANQKPSISSLRNIIQLAIVCNVPFC